MAVRHTANNLKEINIEKIFYKTETAAFERNGLDAVFWSISFLFSQIVSLWQGSKHYVRLSNIKEVIN